MTSDLKNSAGTDFDSLFISGQGTQLFYIYANDGSDVGQRYLPASYGSPAANVGFLDSTGSDIGPKLCLPGSNWTHKITVAHWRGGRDNINRMWGYSKRNGKGTIEYAPGAVAIQSCYAYYQPGMEYAWNYFFTDDGSTYGQPMSIPPWSIYRIDTGRYYDYSSGTSNLIFNNGDTGKTIYLKIKQS